MKKRLGAAAVALMATATLMSAAPADAAQSARAKPRFAYGTQLDPCSAAKRALKTPSRWSNTTQVRWWYGDYCNRTRPPKHFRVNWCPTDNQVGFRTGALSRSQRCGMWWEGGADESDW